MICNNCSCDGWYFKEMKRDAIVYYVGSSKHLRPSGETHYTFECAFCGKTQSFCVVERKGYPKKTEKELDTNQMENDDIEYLYNKWRQEPESLLHLRRLITVLELKMEMSIIKKESQQNKGS